MNAREHEALVSLGMGAGLRRGGASAGRRRFGWDSSGGAGQQQQQQGEDGGLPQALKRPRCEGVAHGVNGGKLS